MTIYHDSRDRKYREPFGAVRTGGTITLSIDAGDDIREAFLQVKTGDAGDYRQIPMNRESSGGFTVCVKAPAVPCLLWYRFRLVSESDGGISTLYYCNNSDALGGEGQVIGSSGELIPYQITVYEPSEVPSWYKDGIVYQIFPDRFARDDDWESRCEEAVKYVNERRTGVKRVIQKDWDKPAYYVRDSQNRVIEWPVYGGSLKGIESKLDHLRSLGVTAIYLNPVFKATSTHRYDTGDYMEIDPALGTKEDFISLAEEARKKGIRLILDGVFSHTGADSIYFDRYGSFGNGAYLNGDSPYRSWYKFDKSEACGYKSWWGVDDLPEVNEEDPGYKEYILGKDGVVRSWLRLGASGWRLDVADELPDPFIRSAKKAIRKEKEDGLLIGEVWEDASNKISYGERRKYFAGDELDGAMNYPLRTALLDYVNYTVSAGRAGDLLMSLAENYPPENLYGALNLIGSHDRERILTMMAADRDRESAVSKVKMLAALEYTLPGVPCIYYGDEAGLTGGADPENRSCYPWGKEDQGLLFHYRMLGLIYDEHPSLRSGGFTMLSGRKDCGGISDDVLAFVRTDGERILVLSNRSYGPSDIDLSGIPEAECGYAIDLLTSKEIKPDGGSLGKIHMDPLSVKIICMKDTAPEKEDLGRSAGVICHLSSLGMHSLGKPAREFVDFLASVGFGVWQVLPLNPPGLGDSPYDSASAFAGDVRFLNEDEIPDGGDYDAFCEDNAWWLKGYVAYTLIRKMQGGKPWYEWPDELRMADPDAAFAMVYSEAEGPGGAGMKAEADRLMRDQYLFCRQWKDLKEYANSRGVRIMGDIPMYMAADSADVWANKEVFLLDENGRLKVHAGVPPDYFSKDGQDWGNPLYDWEKMREEGYDWWMKRLRQCAERYDILRIDHFRGLSEYYAIPEGEKPVKGRWQHSAGLDFILKAKKMLKDEGFGMKLIAEDLGFLDPGVYDLLKLSGLPGMDIWQFTAGEMMSMDPGTAKGRAFYTGTHDNETLLGFVSQHAEDILGHALPEDDDAQQSPEDLSEIKAAAEDIIEKIYESPACLAMLQLQDVFMLGDEARMNVPGVAEGNWSWKIPGESVEKAFPDAAERAEWFRKLAEKTGRA